MAQTIKSLPAMRETRVGSLGREDPLEKEIAAYSSILACNITWTKEPAGYSPWSCKESDERPQCGKKNPRGGLLIPLGRKDVFV